MWGAGDLWRSCVCRPGAEARTKEVHAKLADAAAYTETRRSINPRGALRGGGGGVFVT